jgi:hypothetical protein
LGQGCNGASEAREGANLAVNNNRPPPRDEATPAHHDAGSTVMVDSAANRDAAAAWPALPRGAVAAVHQSFATTRITPVMPASRWG